MRALIALPFLIVLVLFALSNRAPVGLRLWPADYALEVPLSLAVLVAMALGFLVGALLVWISALGQRRRARRAEYSVRLLEEQVDELKAQLSRREVPAASSLAAADEALEPQATAGQLRPQIKADEAT
jgi:lipopolysaccharide assembly protein A